MSQNLKYILTFITVLAFIALCAYGITVYDKHKSREYDLTEKEQANNRVIDSLKVKVYQDSLIVVDLLAAKETEKTNRTNYAVNKNKADAEIYKNPVNINRDYNNKFIYGFKPKYR